VIGEGECFKTEADRFVDEIFGIGCAV